MTDVPQIYQADDPRQGLLGTLIGDSDWKYENQFGSYADPLTGRVVGRGNQYDASGNLTSTGEGVLGKQEGNEYGNYTYKEGEVSAQEPGAYRANANRANRGGVLHSGINQTRVNTIAGRFANQRYWNKKGHTEATQNFGTQRGEGQHGYEADINAKLAEARTKAWERDQEQKQAAAGAAATGLSAQPQPQGAPMPNFTSPQQASEARDEAATSQYIQSHPAGGAQRLWNAGQKKMMTYKNGKWYA